MSLCDNCMIALGAGSAKREEVQTRRRDKIPFFFFFALFIRLFVSLSLCIYLRSFSFIPRLISWRSSFGLRISCINRYIFFVSGHSLNHVLNIQGVWSSSISEETWSFLAEKERRCSCFKALDLLYEDVCLLSFVHMKEQPNLVLLLIELALNTV